jgi:hypothetical protein
MNKHSMAIAFALIGLGAIILASCSMSNEEKARDLICEYMKNHVHNAKSYEVVEFGNLDSTFTSLLDDSVFYNAFEKRLVCQKMRNQLYDETQLWRKIDQNRYNHYNQKLALYVDSADMYYKQEQEARKRFIPQFDGFVMSHTFRTNNELGNPVLNKVAIVFNKELTKVESVNDWNEYQSINIEESLKELEQDFISE